VHFGELTEQEFQTAQKVLLGGQAPALQIRGSLPVQKRGTRSLARLRCGSAAYARASEQLTLVLANRAPLSQRRSSAGVIGNFALAPAASILSKPKYPWSKRMLVPIKLRRIQALAQTSTRGEINPANTFARLTNQRASIKYFMRNDFTKIHLWVGLFAALFSSLKAVTGGILAWGPEIVRLLNPPGAGSLPDYHCRLIAARFRWLN